MRMELLADTNGHEVDSRRWARAAGISHQKLDKILCNGRLSEERIVSSYQRFVGSIAASYQGKGLSLEDLTQVRTETFSRRLNSVEWPFLCWYNGCLKSVGRKHWTSSGRNKV